MEFISDAWFYALAVPAVLIVGFSKAGVGGGLGIMAEPLMVLIVPPVQAAAMLMPLLLFMDVFSLRAYWGSSTAATLRPCCPARCSGW